MKGLVFAISSRIETSEAKWSTLACIHIIWGGHILLHNLKPGSRKLNPIPLTKFLDPVAHFAKKLNLMSNEEDFLWHPHFGAINFPWNFNSPPMWVETYSVFRNEKLTT